jgi:hypothetical protein
MLIRDLLHNLLSPNALTLAYIFYGNPKLSNFMGFTHHYQTIYIYIYIVVYRAVAIKRPRDGRIYHGRFWETAR